MESRKAIKNFIPTLLLSLLMGCAVGPDFHPPEVKVPDQWEEDLLEGFPEGESNLQTWWTTFNDPFLNRLIERAAAGNQNLKEAFGRIRHARSLRRISVSERYPTLGGTGFINRQELGSMFEDNETDNFYGTALDSHWEVDLWGRITRSIQSADSILEASLENYRDVLVVLYAEVASNYVDARTLQTQILYAEHNIKTQTGSLDITKVRFKAKIAPQLDVSQADLNLAITESVIPTLKSRLTQAINRLAVLLGENPGSLQKDFIKSKPIPTPNTEIPTLLPAGLLRQRPDIRRAERELAAQTARIGVASADLYPRFLLEGSFGFRGKADNMDESDDQAWFVGPSFEWKLFEGGAVRGVIEAERALTDQLQARYQQTVLDALDEVENSMTAYARERERKDKLARSVEAAVKSVELVQVLYKSGLTDFQNVLDMERTQFRQQDALADSEGQVTQNLISIYKALGGGWSPDIEVNPKQITRQDQLQPLTTE